MNFPPSYYNNLKKYSATTPFNTPVKAPTTQKITASTSWFFPVANSTLQAKKAANTMANNFLANIHLSSNDPNNFIIQFLTDALPSIFISFANSYMNPVNEGELSLILENTVSQYPNFNQVSPEDQKQIVQQFIDVLTQGLNQTPDNTDKAVIATLIDLLNIYKTSLSSRTVTHFSTTVRHSSSPRNFKNNLLAPRTLLLGALLLGGFFCTWVWASLEDASLDAFHAKLRAHPLPTGLAAGTLLGLLINALFN